MAEYLVKVNLYLEALDRDIKKHKRTLFLMLSAIV